MSRTQAQVADGLRRLRAPGFASPREPDDYVAALDAATAAEFALIEASAEAMLPEANPAYAVNLLPNYERVLGPDPYGRNLLAMTVEERQAIAFSRWTAAPVMCAGFFVNLGAELGVPLTIQEFPLSECGVFECGTEPVPWLQHLCFLVTLPATVGWDVECGVLEAGEPIGGFDPDAMAAIIDNLAPLQMRAAFNYV